MTTDLIVLPYAARLVVGFLLDNLDDALTETGHSDLAVGRNIGTDREHDTFPFVEAVQLGGAVISGGTVHWLSDSLVQINVYGPGGNDRYRAHTIAQVAASLLAQRFRGAVECTIGGDTFGAVVNGCTVGVPIDDTDEELKPARPFSHFDAVIAAHPLPVSGS